MAVVVMKQSRGTYASVGNATSAVSKYLSMCQIYTKWGPFLVANIRGIPILDRSTLSMCVCVCVCVCVYVWCVCVCVWCTLQRCWFWTYCIVDWYAIKCKGYGSRRSWRNWVIMPKFTEENKENPQDSLRPNRTRPTHKPTAVLLHFSLHTDNLTVRYLNPPRCLYVYRDGSLRPR